MASPIVYADCCQGGMVLLSEDMFKQLSPQSLRGACLIMDMGKVVLKNELVPAMSVYQVRTGNTTHQVRMGNTEGRYLKNCW